MQKTIAIALILFFLLSNTGFTLATHYCGGHAVKAEVVTGLGVDGCGMSDEVKLCRVVVADVAAFKPPDCCSDSYVTMQLDCDIALNLFTSQPPLEPLPRELSLATDICPDASEPERLSAIDHPPPAIERDIRIWQQCFLL